MQLDNATPALATSVRVMLEGKVGPGYWMGFGFNNPNLTEARPPPHNLRLLFATFVALGHCIECTCVPADERHFCVKLVLSQKWTACKHVLLSISEVRKAKTALGRHTPCH